MVTQIKQTTSKLVYDLTSELKILTQPELKEWLYEEFGYWISIYIDDDGTFGYHISKIFKGGRLDFPLKRQFKSSTECLEEAIVVVLNKIKELKNKQKS